MLITVIVWVYFMFVFLAYAAGTVAFIRRLAALQAGTPLLFSILAILGLTVAAWFSSVMSLLLEMGLVAHLSVLAGAILIVVYQNQEIKTSFLLEFNHRHWVIWILTLLGFIATILYAVKAPGNPDTPLYHAQAIHWIEDYPAIPGLGNLEPRLGSNSNWLILNAMFSLSFLKLQSLHLVPSFLFLVCILYFLNGLQGMLNGDIRLSQIVKLMFVPFAFYVLIDEISSPGTDLPVILFYWVILCLWLESIEQFNSSRILRVVVFFLSVFVITFKVSGILVLLFAVWVLFDLAKQKEYRLLLGCLGGAVVILIPWIMRTFLLTGYWLYPEPLMEIFSPKVDWMIPVERVLSFKSGIQAWALSPGTSWDEAAELSFIQRLGFWFAGLTLNQKGIVIFALAAPVLFVLFSKRGEKKVSHYLIVLLACLNFLFWLFAAPNFRFGYGFVLGMITLGLAPIIQYVLERFGVYRFYLVIALVLALSAQQVHVILGSTRDGTDYADYSILPADYSRVPTDACNISGVTISCARNWRQCSYEAFPCVPQIPKNVEMRGETFLEGFRRIPGENR